MRRSASAGSMLTGRLYGSGPTPRSRLPSASRRGGAQTPEAAASRVAGSATGNGAGVDVSPAISPHVASAPSVLVVCP